MAGGCTAGSGSTSDSVAHHFFWATRSDSDYAERMKKRDRLALVRQHYPRAITTSESVDIAIDIFEEHLGIEAHQVMLADSICSDDVNTIEYPQRAYDMLGLPASGRRSTPAAVEQLARPSPS